MIYDLPTAIEIGGEKYEIKSDFRNILDICIALNDAELIEDGTLSLDDKAYIILDMFYKDVDGIPYEYFQEAIDKCFWFVNCGEMQDNKKKRPKLVDWEKDFKYIIAPINHMAGREVRSVEYMHWWTFIALYNEISSDCTFAQIVKIRDQLTRGKKLDKADNEWYRRNKELVDLETSHTYTSAEVSIVEEWGGQVRR